MIHNTNGDRRRSGNSNLVIHLMYNPIQQSEASSRSTERRRLVWFGVAVVAICIVFGIGLTRGSNVKIHEGSITHDEADELSGQLRSLKQSDLIQFQDGRIWYVRSVRGDNMEVVGWVGDNARVEDIPSFVLAGERFRIVHQSDRDWPALRDKYLKQ